MDEEHSMHTDNERGLERRIDLPVEQEEPMSKEGNGRRVAGVAAVGTGPEGGGVPVETLQNQGYDLELDCESMYESNLGVASEEYGEVRELRELEEERVDVREQAEKSR